MKLKGFSEFLNESHFLSTKEVRNEWFDNCSDDELKRFIVGFNDGQGDHAFYTFDGILELLKNSDRPGKKELETMTRTEIVDEFFDDLDLNSNNADTVYFDGKQYLKVSWK